MTVLPAHAQDPYEWEEQDTVLVGRISHVEGQLSRYDPESDQWVSTTREAPLGTDDLLRSDPDTRAEILLPNNTWIRINGDTRLQLTALRNEITEVDLPFGNGRFYNKSSRTDINTTTPFGRVMAPPGSAFDLYVGETGVDIVAIKNSVFFFHNASNQRHEVSANSAAIAADMGAVTAIPDNGDPDWVKWNRNMDVLWADRMATRGKSATYLPPELHSEAHALDKHGHWERVYYEGRHYRFWRPVQISASWSPFSWGAWIVWHGDHVWVPHEPFGYVTHHYGNWIFTAGHWYWAPPVTRVMVRARLPLLHIGFGWYPGRVSWIHSGAHVGWFPLGPREPYYTHRHWGRRSIVVAKFRHHHRRHHVYKHRNRAVVIHRSHLYRSSNYRHARIRDISHTTIRKKYRSARVLDRKVLKDYRHHVKRDRFHHKHRPNNYGPSNEIRSKRDRRQAARHYDQKDRHRRGHRRDVVKRDTKSSENRHALKNQRDRRAQRHSGRELDKNRRSERKQLTRRTEERRRKAPPKEIEKRGHRRSRDESAVNKQRRTDERRSRNKGEVRSQRDRRIEKQQNRPSSPRLVTAPDRRKSDRRRSHVEASVKRQKPRKEIKDRTTQRNKRERQGAVSRRKDRHRVNREITPRRSSSQPRQSASNRMTRRTKRERQPSVAGYEKRQERQAIRSAPPKRQRQHAVRMPAERKSPDRSVSRQDNRSRRGDQKWRPSNGRRNNERAAHRSRSKRHRGQHRN